jgi:WD40 repeat protein
MATTANAIPDPSAGKPPRASHWIPVSLRMCVAMLVLLGVGAVWLGTMTCQQRVATVPDIKLPASPWRIRVSPTGHTLACLSILRTADRSGGSVIVADTAQLTVPRELVRFDAIVRDVAWSPDEKYLALGTYDGRIEVWESATMVATD